MKDKNNEKFGVQIIMKTYEGEVVELGGRGAVIFCVQDFNGSDHLTQITHALYGKLSTGDIARKILTMIEDKNDDETADFWRRTIANVLGGLFIAEGGEAPDKITGRISVADAFAMDAMDKAGKERQA